MYLNGVIGFFIEKKYHIRTFGKIIRDSTCRKALIESIFAENLRPIILT